MLEINENHYIDIVYRRIIFLAILLHMIYVCIFLYFDVFILCWYNILSVVFYGLMQCFVKKRYFKFVVSAIHIEVCVFTIISTLFVGWDAGFAFYLVALTSLTYFCPYEHQYTPYLFAVFEIILFFILKFYTAFYHQPIVINHSYDFILYIFNVLSSFIVILYAAFSSKVSAVVSQKKLKIENQNLFHLANNDELTGLLNRHGMIEKLNMNKPQHFILVMGDIDDFKVINDTWGHAVGDRILHETAHMMKKELNGIAEVCRWGGEEFIYLFYDIDVEKVIMIMQNIRHILSEYTYQYHDFNIQLTMTFGIAEYQDGDTLDTVIAVADRQMYLGKNQGKNRVMYEK